MADIVPPFTAESANKKVKFAQDLWNTRTPDKVVKGYTANTIWRNRGIFAQGTAAIHAFLTAKWEKEQSYKLRKEIFTFSDNKIAVQFWYEYQDAHDGMKWKRCYGLEDWTYDAADGGKMRKRMMSGNDILLGKNGDGVAVPEEGIEGRWFVDGVDVNTVDISEKHW